MKRLFAFILLSAFLLISCITATAVSVPLVEDTPSVYDGGDLLYESDEYSLTARLDSLKDIYGYEVIVVTADTLGSLTAQEYADDFYDYNGYDFDGILLLICMEYRDWAISTCGDGITVFNDAAQSYIIDNVKPYLSDEDFYEAFITFADCCGELLGDAENGYYYGDDYDYGYNDYYDTTGQSGVYFSTMWIPTAIIVGVVIAFIAVLIMKGQLKSVRYQSGARSYLRQGSLNVTDRRDIFLYSTVSRRAKPKDTNNSSGGSSTHRSSSGRSHGGSSGKF